jgi:putative copper export protein
MQRRCRLGAEALAGFGVLVTVVAVIEQAFRSVGGLTEDALQAIADTQLGEILLARTVLAVIIFALLVVRFEAFVHPHVRSVGAASAAAMRAHRIAEVNQHVIVPPLVLGDLLLLAVTSHALASPRVPVLVLLADWMHLAAAGVWVGGLAALTLVLLPSMRPSQQAVVGARWNEVVPLLKRFSQVALLAAAAVAASGMCLAWAHVGSVAKMLATDYGRAIAVKSVLFAAAMGLAAVNRFVLLPRPRRKAQTPDMRGWRRTIPGEALLGLGILSVAAIGTNLPPPTQSSGPPPIATREVNGMLLALQIEPLKAGPNMFEMTLERHGARVVDAQKVELQLSPADGESGPAVVDMTSVGKGEYAAQSDALGLSGPWHVVALVRTPGEFDRQTTFDVTVPDSTAASSATSAISSALPEAGDLTFGSNIGNTLVGLTLRPGTPGRNQVLVYVSPQREPPAGSVLDVSFELQGTQVPLQTCSATCWLASVDVRGGEEAHVAVDGSGPPAVFHIPALPAAPADTLLSQVTQRMHELQSLRTDETYVTATPPLTIHYELQAPDRMKAHSTGGTDMVSVGRTRFVRSAPDHAWQGSELVQTPTVPSVMWDGLSPQSVYFADAESANGSTTRVVDFFAVNGHSPAWFQLWVQEDGLTQRLQMRAPRHFMDERFFDFNQPFAIDLPSS